MLAVVTDIKDGYGLKFEKKIANFFQVLNFEGAFCVRVKVLSNYVAQK